MFYETHLHKEQIMLFVAEKIECFAVSDALIDFLFDFSDTSRKVKVHGF